MLADPEGSHCQPVLVMAAARWFADRHWLVVRFEHPDRAGDVFVADRAVMADVGEVPGHAVHSSGVLWLWLWCGSLPAAGILATVGAAYGGRCISIQSHDILDQPRVKLMPRVVGRMKCDRSTPAVDRHEFGMIDRESRPVHHDELERPERLPANLFVNWSGVTSHRLLDCATPPRSFSRGLAGVRASRSVQSSSSSGSSSTSTSLSSSSSRSPSSSMTAAACLAAAFGGGVSLRGMIAPRPGASSGIGSLVRCTK